MENTVAVDVNADLMSVSHSPCFHWIESWTGDAGRTTREDDTGDDEQDLSHLPILP